MRTAIKIRVPYPQGADAGDRIQVYGDFSAGGSPTTVQIPLSKDAYIRDSAPTTNFGTGNMQIGVGAQTASVIERGAVHVDLSGVPAGKFITDATLYGSYINSPRASGGGPGKAKRITQAAWVELQATWNRYATLLDWILAGGDFTSTDEVNWTIPVDGTGVAVPLIPGLGVLAQDAYANRGKQLHLMLMAANEAVDQVSVICRARDYSIGGHQPYLEVTYVDGIDLTRPLLKRAVPVFRGARKRFGGHGTEVYGESSHATGRQGPDPGPGHGSEIYGVTPHGTVPETMEVTVMVPPSYGLHRFSARLLDAMGNPQGAALPEVTVFISSTAPPGLASFAFDSFNGGSRRATFAFTRDTE